MCTIDMAGNIERRIAGLTEAGWDADVGNTDEETFEALVHEIAHNVVLGDTTPKDPGDTARLIERHGLRNSDLDEVLATAITIQVCEHYGHLTCTGLSLSSVSRNIRNQAIAIRATDLVIEHINTPEVLGFWVGGVTPSKDPAT